VRINVQFCAQTPRTKPPDKSASDHNFRLVDNHPEALHPTAALHGL